MRRFHFRFQRILEIKERVEEVRKIALGEAVAALNRAREDLRLLEKRRALYREAAQPRAAVRLDPGLLGMNARYDQYLERGISTQRRYIGQVELTVDKRRRHLGEAVRERRTYEILKERARAAHRREQKRRERVWLDEVGGQIHRRRRMRFGEQHS